MSTIPAAELLKEWKLQLLTLERGMGNTLQHLVMLHEQAEQANRNDIRLTNQLETISHTLAEVQAELERVKRHVGLAPKRRGRPRQAGKT